MTSNKVYGILIIFVALIFVIFKHELKSDLRNRHIDKSCIKLRTKTYELNLSLVSKEMRGHC